MAFRIFPVVLGIFIINFGTAVTEKHDDCFKYDAQVPNGKNKIDLYHECGITDAKTMSNPKRVKCVVKANQAVNEDGTINKEAAHTIINDYAYPEYKDQLLEMVDELLKQPPQSFYTRYPKGVAKICPKDQLYGNPKGTKKNSSH